jgi:hypothetical protein
MLLYLRLVLNREGFPFAHKGVPGSAGLLYAVYDSGGSAASSWLRVTATRPRLARVRRNNEEAPGQFRGLSTLTRCSGPAAWWGPGGVGRSIAGITPGSGMGSLAGPSRPCGAKKKPRGDRGVSFSTSRTGSQYWGKEGVTSPQPNNPGRSDGFPCRKRESYLLAGRSARGARRVGGWPCSCTSAATSHAISDGVPQARRPRCLSAMPPPREGEV